MNIEDLLTPKTTTYPKWEFDIPTTDAFLAMHITNAWTTDDGKTWQFSEDQSKLDIHYMISSEGVSGTITFNDPREYLPPCVEALFSYYCVGAYDEQTLVWDIQDRWLDDDHYLQLFAISESTDPNQVRIDMNGMRIKLDVVYRNNNSVRMNGSVWLDMHKLRFENPVKYDYVK